MTGALLEGLILLAIFVVLFVLPALFGAWRIRREERRQSPLTRWEKRRGQLLAEEREWRNNGGCTDERLETDRRTAGRG